MTTNGFQKLILYDFPSNSAQISVSPRTWRVRLVLNHKQIPYRTEWLDFPDIKAKGQELGVPSTAKDPVTKSEIWTIPMLVDPNRLDSNGKPTAITNSTTIVQYLDKTYPDKRVIPEGLSALFAGWEQLIDDTLIIKFWRLIIPMTPRILSPVNSDYFVETRTSWWGPLDKFCPDRQKAQEEAKAAFGKIAALLDGNEASESKEWTVIPNQVTYADFTLAASILWATGVLDEEEISEIRSWNNGRIGTLLDGLKEKGLLQVY